MNHHLGHGMVKKEKQLIPMIVFNRISEILFESLESFQWYDDYFFQTSIRGGSRTTTTSKMEHFVIIVNGWKPLTIITKCSILDVAAVLDPPLSIYAIALS